MMALQKSDKVSISYWDPDQNEGVDEDIYEAWFQRDIESNNWEEATWIEVTEECLSYTLSAFLASESVGRNLEKLELDYLDVNEEALVALLNNPAMTSLRELSLGLTAAPEGASALAMIVEAPYLKDLHTLIIEPEILSDRDIEALTNDNRSWQTLSLSTPENRSIRTREGLIGALVQAFDAAHIQELILSRHVIGHRDVAQIQSAQCLSMLRKLCLFRCVNPEGDPISFDIIRSLFTQQSHHALQSLHLANINGEGHDFGTWPVDALPNLQDLSLTKALPGNDALTSLVDSALCSNLTSLSLCFNDITAHGIKSLAESKHMRKLEELDLYGNGQIGDAGAEYLAASPHLKKLKALDMSNCQLSFMGVRKLLNSTTLKLKKAQIKTGELVAPDDITRYEGTDRIIYILESGMLDHSPIMDLSKMRLTADQIDLLIHHPSAKKIKELNVSRCRLSNEDVLKLLGDTSNWNKLKTLNLSKNALTNDVGEPLSKLKKLHALDNLDITENQLGLSGFRKIFESSDWEYVCVRGNKASSGQDDDIYKNIFDEYYDTIYEKRIDITAEAG